MILGLDSSTGVCILHEPPSPRRVLGIGLQEAPGRGGVFGFELPLNIKWFSLGSTHKSKDTLG